MDSTAVVDWAAADSAEVAEAAADSEAADWAAADSEAVDSAVEDLAAVDSAVEDWAAADSAVEDLAADSEEEEAADLPRGSRPARDPRHCRSRSIPPRRVLHRLKSRQRHQPSLLEPRRLCRSGPPSKRRASNSTPGRTGIL